MIKVNKSNFFPPMTYVGVKKTANGKSKPYISNKSPNKKDATLNDINIS